MRGESKASQTLHVFRHVPRLTGQRKRCAQTDRRIVAAIGADLDAVEAQHTRPIGWGVRCPRAVAVIGKDHELKTTRRGGGSDLVERTRPIRSNRVDVKCAFGGWPGRIDCRGNGGKPRWWRQPNHQRADTADQRQD